MSSMRLHTAFQSRFGIASQLLVDGLHVIKQVRAGVKKAGLVFQGHLVAQAQGPLNGHAGVAEVGVVEGLGDLAVDLPAVDLHDLGDLSAGEVAALVAEAALVGFAAASGPHIARIKKLDLALAPLLLAVGDDPDVGADTGVVEHLLGQGDDALDPVVLDDPLADVALARARAAGKEGRAAEDDGEPRAVLVFRRPHGFSLVPHVLQEEQRAVVHARQPGAEAAVKTTLVVLLLDLLLLLLPVHAEGRISEEVVEGLAVELVLGKAVAVPNVVTAAVVVNLLHQHVGRRGGEGALVVVLPIDIELRGAMVLPQVVLRLRQHAAGAAGGVEQLADGAGCGEQFVVVNEQDAHHQSDDLARREMVARGLVGQFVEAPDEVLEEKSHLLVRHRVWVQVNIAELRDDEVEDVRLAHPLDLVLELEEIKDVAHIPRETLDVADEVLLDVVGVALELLEVEGGVVVKALAGGHVQPLVQGFALDLATFAPRMFGQDLGFRRGEHAVEAAQHGHRQHDALVLRRAVGAT